MSEIDIRCSVTLHELSPVQGRCQLFMGHEGTHAVMFSRGDERLVRCWQGREAARVVDRRVDDEQRPWMRGYPTPAWIDEGSSVAGLTRGRA